MVLYIIFAVVGLAALATVILGIFMLMDAKKARDRDDFASRVTTAVDTTAKANGLWTRRLRVSAIVFFIILIAATLAAIYIMQQQPASTWGTWGG